MGFNINIIHKHSVVSVLYRVKLTRCLNGLPAGTKGWLTWFGDKLCLTVDLPPIKSSYVFDHIEPIEIVAYAKRSRKLLNIHFMKTKKSCHWLYSHIKRIDATDYDRLNYFVRNLERFRFNFKFLPNKVVDYEKIYTNLKTMIDNKEFEQVNKYMNLLVDDIETEQDINTPFK